MGGKKNREKLKRGQTVLKGTVGQCVSEKKAKTNSGEMKRRRWRDGMMAEEEEEEDLSLSLFPCVCLSLSM